MKVKICGLKFPGNIRAIAALKPDYMGFIFFPDSRRYVGKEFPATVIESITGDIKKVGVFVNAPLEEVMALQTAFSLDYIQLHGHESPEYCKQLNQKGVYLIKAFNLHEGFDFSVLEKYSPYCQYFLFDSPTASYGGSGKSFNWRILARYDLNIPFLLSGGLGPENIAEALSINHPMLHGMDLNSRLESEPGLKDIEKTRQMIEKIKTYGHV